MITYEQRLNSNLNWAFREGSMHFKNASAVHVTLRKITHKLEELGIPYAVVGGMAMFYHGYRRFTEDVDILVTREDLKLIHERLEGRGYLPPFTGSKHLRDTVTGVRVEFLTTGDYPGDGKPKPISFPHPDEASVEIEGIRFLRLARLVDLKLASGMTNPGRMSDLGDVQKLITLLGLSETFAEELDPFVREKFREFCQLMKAYPQEP